ncbi:alpha/beta fold hydrolase [Pelagicoccus enzymogenes]|uniref:alpha/beta hydrolase family protein n=1 Tax=Pelagicoccus enzymogenes TaxID=2773457 RepID=UPI00280EA0DA|nr:alpha/beta fold hydrolase [Pelagicoccus enzymogenes]MDQ8197468.1 alpha/beta fold hydrolase [Pelagicoccus enzymogenes]
MKRSLQSTLLLLVFGCLSVSFAAKFQPQPQSLLEKRAGFQTKLLEKETIPWPLEAPPAEIASLVTFPTPIGEMEAYLTHPSENDRKQAAIVWLTGGLPGSVPGSWLWDEPDLENEQTASIYRESGIVVLYPSLRGRSANNPGYVESFFGEVDDVIATYDYLSQLKHIDPERIYLGGHSTGGTLALLVAASTDKFAGIISLGPTDDNYGQENAPYQWKEKEQYLRAPIHHLTSIKSPTYIIEGIDGNHHSLLALEAVNKNPLVRTITVRDSDHFQLIHPVNTIFAQAIRESKEGALDIDPIAIQLSVDRSTK